jgi:hypothetical protein
MILLTKYGNIGSIQATVTKDEREAGTGAPYIGNFKEPATAKAVVPAENKAVVPEWFDLPLS